MLKARKNGGEPTLLPPHNTYQFSDLPSFLRSSYMSLSVLRGLDGVWSSQYSCLFAPRKVKLRKHFAYMSAMASLIDMWLFRYRYSKRKFSYYATMHRTTFHAEHNDHTFYSVPAYYACNTSTVWEHFIDAYCMYHTLLQLTVPAVSRISSMH